MLSKAFKKAKWLMLVALLIFGQIPLSASSTEITPILEKRLSEISSSYIIVNFWSPYCLPCGDEVAQLNEVLKSVNLKNPKTLQIVGIPVQGRKSEVSSFVDHFKPDYPQLDLKIPTESVGQVPLTLLLGPNRQVIKKWNGKITAAEVQNEFLTNIAIQ